MNKEINPSSSPTPWRLFKLGGASVKDAQGVRQAIQLMRSQGKPPMVLVISAMGKTTNALEAVVQSLFTSNPEAAKEKMKEVQAFHQSICDELELSKEVSLQVQSFWDEAMRASNTEYAPLYDAVVSAGELASTTIVAAALKALPWPVLWIDARRVVVTNTDFRRASVDFYATENNTKDWKENALIVTQGFIGATPDGVTTTLGREGSDYTAAVLAYCLSASEVTVWKDVPGVMSGDPKYFSPVELLKTIPYREAIELAYYGASVIHPKTVQPLQQKGIALRVRSFLHPQEVGSWIGDTPVLDPLTPCFIRKGNQVLVSVSTRDLRFIAEEHLSNIYTLFYQKGVEVNAVQHGATHSSFCFTHDAIVFPEVLKTLNETFSVTYNVGLELYTIRHATPESLQWIRSKGSIYLEQSTRSTAQLLVYCQV